MWFVLALGSAVFFASQGALAKHLHSRYHPDVLAWAAFVFSVPVFWIAVAAEGLPTVDTSFWGYLALSQGVNLIAIPLYFRALESGELSVVLPLSTLTPMFALVTEYLMLQEEPALLAVAGVGLIVMGAYLLNVRELSRGFWAPLVALGRNRGARLMLVAATLWSISSVADRGAVHASSALFYIAVASVTFTVAFFPYLIWHRPHALWEFVRRPWPTVWMSACGMAMALCQMLALNLAQAALVISIKRLAALFGVVLGGLFFREKGLVARIAASALMVAGAAVLGFF